MALDGHPGTVVSTYLPVRDAERLRSRAAAADRSVAAEVRRVVQAYLSLPDHEADSDGNGGNFRAGDSRARS
jgi:hypothetical protein